VVRILEAFRTLDPDLPIQYALSFLTIAQNEGLSIRDLSERLGIAQSSASRNVAALSKWHSFGKEGHDLVQSEEDPRERRRKIVTLTPKGRDLARRLVALLDGDGTGGNHDGSHDGPPDSPRITRGGTTVEEMPLRRRVG
jgi:DNA-binding MarR family transcriptional regulator